MDKNLVQMDKFLQKFQQLKSLDEKNKGTSSSVLLKSTSQPFNIKATRKQKKPEEKQAPTHDLEIQKEIVYTQSDIAKEVAKMKPYLAITDQFKTSEEIQQARNKQMSQQNYKMMSDLIITENRKLCQVLEETQKWTSKNQMKNFNLQKKGWIFQICFKIFNQATKKQASKIQFINGYALMTELVEIFGSLTFESKMFTIRVSDITMIKYMEVNNYEVMRIQQDTNVIDIGFLDEKTFNLFDRMLFLQKNMSRSTPTRLFQNQLLRNMYEEY